ncbi:MAG: OmpA family protein, partial [Myxococcota bacterium]
RLEGDHINIDKKIMFETDSAVIRPESNELLDNIATVMKNHPEIETLHVIGHTDSTGDDNHNMELSNKRAEAVMTALKERGVEQPMDHRGAGETELTCSDETPECHDANRRVEFKVDIKGVEAG